MKWKEILPHIWLFCDSCNVYAVQGPKGLLIIDAGTGQWLDYLSELPAKPASLVLTHYFRDHSAGALAASQAGIPIYAGEHDYEKYVDPVQYFSQRNAYLMYDCEWDLFSPIEPIPITGILHDYMTISLAGLSVEVIPLPGAPMSQIGFGLSLGENGRQVVFSGETIHSPGRVPRIAPLQYDYVDIPGLANVYYSAEILCRRKSDALLPSLGEPILEDIDNALVQLQSSLRRICQNRITAFGGLSMIERLDLLHSDPLVKVTDHIYLNRFTNCNTWFVISDCGKALALDCGYLWFPIGMARYPKSDNRRPLLHSVDELNKRFGINQIDVVLLSHFHDDHVAGVPLLQRLHGTECWATDNFADLVEQPHAHRFPCTSPRAMKVNRRIRFDETVQWEEYEFHFAPLSGHTRFATLIGFEADGKRYAHVGDQYFFQHDDLPPSHANPISPSFVYSNGALLNGFTQSAEWLRKWRPDIVIGGHVNPIYTNEEFFDITDDYGREYRHSHEQAMSLGDEDMHFNLDSCRGWIWPYRLHLPVPGPAKVCVTVRNPLPHTALLDVRLVGPDGWKGSSASISATPRAEVSCQLQIIPAGFCRRQPFVLELEVEGRRFGQVAEALLTVGGSTW